MLQVEDIGDRKQTERELRRLADHDSLTGLLNRRGFMDGLRRELRRMERKGEYGALLLLDLDNFKLVNDTAGHLAGDQVLRTTADVLRRRLRATDVIGRLGGDEFAALVLNVTPRQASEIAAETTETLRAMTVTAGDVTIEVAAEHRRGRDRRAARRERGGAARRRRPRDVPRQEPAARRLRRLGDRRAARVGLERRAARPRGGRGRRDPVRPGVRPAAAPRPHRPRGLGPGCALRLPASRCLTLPLVSPLDAAGDEYLLSAHMLEHVLIGDAAPALLVLAVRGPLLAFWSRPPRSGSPVAHRGRHAAGRPARHARSSRSRSGRRAIGGLARARALRRGADAVRGSTRSSTRASSAPGFLVWALLIDPAGRRPLSVGGRAALAGAVFMLGQLLCGVLFLSPSPLYPPTRHHAPRLFGLSPLADQQYAGLVMMAEQLADARHVRRAARLVAPAARPQAATARVLGRREREAGRHERRLVGEDAERLVRRAASPSTPVPASPIANAAVA